MWCCQGHGQWAFFPLKFSFLIWRNLLINDFAFSEFSFWSTQSLSVKLKYIDTCSELFLDNGLLISSYFFSFSKLIVVKNGYFIFNLINLRLLPLIVSLWLRYLTKCRGRYLFILNIDLKTDFSPGRIVFILLDNTFCILDTS